MYDTLIMLKPDSRFSPDDMETIVRNVAESAGRNVERQGTSVVLKSSGAYLQVDCNKPHVIEKSKEIAVAYGIPCDQCAARFEMNGAVNRSGRLRVS